MTSFHMSILKTLAYYDCSDWPLTGFEIWKYLAKISGQRAVGSGQKVELGDILRALDEPEVKLRVAEKNGFYFLKERVGDGLTEKRVEAEKLADMKWKILKRRAKWMALVPYIRLIMASGSIAMGRVEEKSDLDTFVITKTGRIWTARFLLTIFFDLLGWRRRGKATKNKFCLNHYLTDQSLILESRNVSTAMGYYGRLIPVLGDLDLFQKFLEANQWLGEYLEQYPPSRAEARFGGRRPGSSDTLTQRYARPPKTFLLFARLLESIFNPFWGDWIEKTLRALQLKKIYRNPLTHDAPGQVIASDQELRFHPGPQERDILEKYYKRLAQLGIGSEGS